MVSDQLIQLDAGYENVVAVCPKCTVRNVYNRADDIGHFNPIANGRVACADCGAAFTIGGDLVNAAHEMLLLDSNDFLREKRYVQAVLSATTAYEVFFNHFLLVELVFRPLNRDRVNTRDIDQIAWLNDTSALLRDKISKFTFEPMRRTFLRFAIERIAVGTVAQAEACINTISKRPKRVERATVAHHTDERLRTLLLRLYDSDIAELRNNIVHKTAYRPTRSETRSVVEDATYTIANLTNHFGLGNVNYHLNE
jgi:hypothetical protein